MITKMRDMMKRKNGQKGFTLIELIVVMAILAILAAIAVPRYQGVLNNAQTTADKATARTIASAVTLAEAQKAPAAATIADVNTFLDGITVAAAAAEPNTWGLTIADPLVITNPKGVVISLGN